MRMNIFAVQEMLFTLSTSIAMNMVHLRFTKICFPNAGLPHGSLGNVYSNENVVM